MAVTFIKGCDAIVSNLIATIYGAPSSGKTSLAFTADKPVLFDFDGGVHRSANRGEHAVAQISRWRDIADLKASDVAEFNTIVVDTVGTCLDKLAVDIITSNPKMVRGGGALTLQGYGVLKSRFKLWLDTLRSYGKDIVLIAHATEERRGEDEIVERIQAPGASKNEIYQQSDIMGRLEVKDGQRVLTFNTSQASYGKNCGLPDYIVRAPVDAPDTMAGILADAKRCINGNAETQAQEASRLTGIKSWLDAIETVDGFNEALVKMRDENAVQADKAMLLTTAQNKGFVFDRQAGMFAMPAAMEE